MKHFRVVLSQSLLLAAALWLATPNPRAAACSIAAPYVFDPNAPSIAASIPTPTIRLKSIIRYALWRVKSGAECGNLGSELRFAIEPLQAGTRYAFQLREAEGEWTSPDNRLES